MQTTPRVRLVAMAISLLVLAGCQEDLYTNLDEREANLMIATLELGGISAERVMQKDGGLSISVDRARFGAAVRLLDDAGLPRQRFASMGEVFQNEGLVASPMQERARLLYALSEELSRTVSEIDGIQTARVHIVLPENDPLRRNATASSASVFVRHDAALDVTDMIPRIKTLVANGISGLSYDKVSVITTAAAPPASQRTAEPMRSILGIWVLETSYVRAVTVFCLLGGMIAAMGAGLGWMWWRGSRRPRSYILEPSE